MDSGAGPRPVALPAADVLVDEVRAEAFGTVRWKATDRLTLEGGLAVETSAIGVTGDVVNSQRSTFFKPPRRPPMR